MYAYTNDTSYDSHLLYIAKRNRRIIVHAAPLKERYPVWFVLWLAYNIYTPITVLPPLAFDLPFCVNCYGLFLIASQNHGFYLFKIYKL